MTAEELEQQRAAEQAALAAKAARETGTAETVGGDTLPCGRPPLKIPDTLKEFLETSYPPIAYVVEGIFNEKDTVIVAAPTGTGKTWLGVDLGLCIGAGVPYWNRHTAKGKVVYFFWEGGGAAFQKRVRMVKDAYAAEGVNLEESDFLPLDVWEQGEPVTFENIEDWVVETLERKGWIGQVKAIFIDPASYLCAGFDENDNAKGTLIGAKAKAIAVRTGAAVVFFWHTGKGVQWDKGPVEMIRGASAVPSAFDDKFGMAVDPKRDGTEDKPKVMQFAGFGRNLERNVKIYAQFTVPRWRLENETGGEESSTTAKGPGRPKATGDADVFSLFTEREQTFTMADFKTTFKANGWGSAETCRKFVKELVRDGFLEETGTAACYRFALGKKWREEWDRRRRMDPWGVNRRPDGEIGDADVRTLAGLFTSAEEGEKGLERAAFVNRGRAQLMKEADVDGLLRLGVAAEVLQSDGKTIPTFRLQGRGMDARKALDMAGSDEK